MAWATTVSVAAVALCAACFPRLTVTYDPIMSPSAEQRSLQGDQCAAKDGFGSPVAIPQHGQDEGLNLQVLVNLGIASGANVRRVGLKAIVQLSGDAIVHFWLMQGSLSSAVPFHASELRIQAPSEHFLSGDREKAEVQIIGQLLAPADLALDPSMFDIKPTILNLTEQVKSWPIIPQGTANGTQEQAHRLAIAVDNAVQALETASRRSEEFRAALHGRKPGAPPGSGPAEVWNRTFRSVFGEGYKTVPRKLILSVFLLEGQTAGRLGDFLLHALATGDHVKNISLDSGVHSMADVPSGEEAGLEVFSAVTGSGGAAAYVGRDTQSPCVPALWVVARQPLTVDSSVWKDLHRKLPSAAAPPAVQPLQAREVVVVHVGWGSPSQTAVAVHSTGVWLQRLPYFVALGLAFLALLIFALVVDCRKKGWTLLASERSHFTITSEALESRLLVVGGVLCAIHLALIICIPWYWTRSATCKGGYPAEPHSIYFAYSILIRCAEVCFYSQVRGPATGAAVLLLKTLVSLTSNVGLYSDMVFVNIALACGSWLWMPSLTIFLATIANVYVGLPVVTIANSSEKDRRMTVVLKLLNWDILAESVVFSKDVQADGEKRCFGVAITFCRFVLEDVAQACVKLKFVLDVEPNKFVIASLCVSLFRSVMSLSMALWSLSVARKVSKPSFL